MSTSIHYMAIFIQFLVAAGFVAVVMIVTHLAGPNRKTKEKLATFECGIETKGNARLPFNIRYFLTAILFVMFDVEVIFMYPWAVNFKSIPNGFFEMFIFIGALLIGFIYIIKKGGLKWEA